MKKIIILICVMLGIFISSTVAAASNFTFVANIPVKDKLSSVITDGKTFIAIGNNAILYSKDSVNWRKVLVPKSTLVKDFGTAWCVYAKDKFYIGSQDNTDMLSSKDGIKWTLGKNDKKLSKLFWTGKMFVGYSAEGFHSSIDGVKWSDAKQLSCKDGNGTPINPRFADIVNLKETFYAVSADQEAGSYIYKSTDGFSWTRVYSCQQFALYNMAVIDGTIFAHGAMSWTSQGFIISSTDGETWNSTIFDNSGTNVEAMFKFDKYYVGYATNNSATVEPGIKLVYSTDTKKWDELLLDSKITLVDICSSKSTIIGIEKSGKIITINQKQFNSMMK